MFMHEKKKKKLKSYYETFPQEQYPTNISKTQLISDWEKV